MHDSELVEAIQAGDREAFGRLVERYQTAIYRLCHRVTGNIPDAEELAHDAFVEAYLKLAQLRDPVKFGPWLKTLALNLCRMWYRRNRREGAACLEEHAAEPEEDRSVYVRMFGGLSQLSAAHRLVLVLHYWEGLSYGEVATFLGVPAGTVMSRLHRARRELKRLMEAMEDDEEMAAMPEEGFKQEVEAEIAVLLAMFGENADARERLSVIMSHSPERFAQLIHQATDEKTLANLGLLLRRLGRPALEVTLGCNLSADTQLCGRAATLLRRFIATAKPGPDGSPGTQRNAGCGRMARLEAYLLMDLLIQAAAEPDAKARLLDELLEACSEERTCLLLTNVLLCFPQEAFPLLLTRFWGASSPADLYRPGSVLYALCRMGTRFVAALLEPLHRGEPRQQVLALAGAEAVARSLRCDWLDPDQEPDERVALEARFRWKWAPPLASDRDPELLQELASALVTLLASESPEIREAALRVLGLLRAETYREQLESCVRAPHPGTRRAALRAVAEIGDARSAPLLMAVAEEGDTKEQQEAIQALGRLRATQAEPLLITLVDHPDPDIGRAAAFALGDIGSETAQARLRALLPAPGPLRQAAARAIFAGVAGRRASLVDRATRRELTSPGRMAELIRGGARPSFYIALDAAIRALPALQSYDEATLSRHIGRVCVDWAGTRRQLVEERLMVRENGVYRFTELGGAVWRVEKFIEKQYPAIAHAPASLLS